MVCREPLLRYTNLQSEPVSVQSYGLPGTASEIHSARPASTFAIVAMVCREPLLRYTHKLATNTLRMVAMVCREPLLRYTIYPRNWLFAGGITSPEFQKRPSCMGGTSTGLRFFPRYISNFRVPALFVVGEGFALPRERRALPYTDHQQPVSHIQPRRAFGKIKNSLSHGLPSPPQSG